MEYIAFEPWQLHELQAIVRDLYNREKGMTLEEVRDLAKRLERKIEDHGVITQGDSL